MEIRLVVGIFFIIVKHISEVLAGTRKVSGCSFIFDKKSILIIKLQVNDFMQ